MQKIHYLDRATKKPTLCNNDFLTNEIHNWWLRLTDNRRKPHIILYILIQSFRFLTIPQSGRFIKETFCKKIKWNMEFDHIFWFPSIVWKYFKNTECPHLLHQSNWEAANSTSLILSKILVEFHISFYFLTKSLL